MDYNNILPNNVNKSIRGIVFSYIWRAWGQTLVLPYIRNIILGTYCMNNIYIGSTIDRKDYGRRAKTYPKDIKRILETDIKNAIKLNKNAVIATIANYPDESLETHYNSIYINILTKIVTIYDPSNPCGTYSDCALRPILIEIFESIGYQSVEYTPTTACQFLGNEYDSLDIFCQTWSLYMVIENICKNQPIEFNDHLNKAVKARQDIRYQILLNFMRQLLDIPILCIELQKAFITEIKETKDIYGKLPPQEYGLYNSCKWILNAKINDLY